MKPQFFKFPKIGQFKDAIKRVKDIARYDGKDENGDPIYNEESLPTLTFLGIPKVHGTNASIVLLPDGEMYAQSRNRTITPGKDNAGFAAWVELNKETILEEVFLGIPDGMTAIIWGEWAGPGVNKDAVGIAELETKMFFPFAAGVINLDGELEELMTQNTEPDLWKVFVEEIVETWENTDEENVRAQEFKCFPLPRIVQPMSMEIDFNSPQEVQNELIRITEEIEKECPVSKVFGIKGTGEGMVWSSTYKGEVIRFKVKGEEHSVTKVKTLAPVDEVMLESIKEFCDYAVTENRVKQAITDQFGIAVPTKKDTGTIVNWVKNDVFAEEMTAILENGMDPGKLAGPIQARARQIFFKILDSV